MSDDPFAPENFGGVKMPRQSGSRPAKVRIRLKGNTDGPVFEGAKEVQPCKTCGPKLTPREDRPRE